MDTWFTLSAFTFTRDMPEVWDGIGISLVLRISTGKPPNAARTKKQIIKSKRAEQNKQGIMQPCHCRSGFILS